MPEFSAHGGSQGCGLFPALRAAVPRWSRCSMLSWLLSSHLSLVACSGPLLFYLSWSLLELCHRSLPPGSLTHVLSVLGQPRWHFSPSTLECCALAWPAGALNNPAPACPGWCSMTKTRRHFLGRLHSSVRWTFNFKRGFELSLLPRPITISLSQERLPSDVSMAPAVRSPKLKSCWWDLRELISFKARLHHLKGRTVIVST